MNIDILKFINEFKSATKLFTEGKCYWFAIILKERFGGQLFYNPIMNHWACLIQDVLYDVTGALDSEGFYTWPDCVIEDTLLYQRLINQCIEFNE